MGSSDEDDENDSQPLPDGEHEEDRQAILARRQRFIALALGGLVSAAGCQQSVSARPAPEDHPSEGPDANDGRTSGSRNEPDADAGAEPDAEPVPCLNVAIPEDREGRRRVAFDDSDHD